MIFLCLLTQICLISWSVNINECAFNGDELLGSEHVTQSGSYSTYTSIIIKEGITGLKPSALSSCSSLQYISISSSCSNMTGREFSAYNLISISVSENNPTVCADSQGALFSKNMTVLLRVPGTKRSFIIHNTVKQIICGAITRNLQELEIPSSVEIFEYAALNGLGPMKNLTFASGSKAKVFPESSFWYNSASEFHVPPSVERIEASAMYSSGSNVIIFDDIENSNLTYIGSSAMGKFLGTKITLPRSVQVISSGAFSESPNLVSINIPEKCFSLSSSVFNGCPRLQTVTVDQGNTFYETINGSLLPANRTALIFVPPSVEELFIPSTMTAVGSGLIQSKENLTRLKVENTSSYFSEENGVLYNANKTILYGVCGGIREVFCPASVEKISGGAASGVKLAKFIFLSNGTLTEIGDSAFKSSSIEAICIPSPLTYLSYYCFKECRSLNSLTFCPGSQMAQINGHAFYHCSLESIHLPPQLCVLQHEVFIASSIINITYDEGIRLWSIGSRCFESCSLLTNFVIPKSVKQIDENAFKGCQKYKLSFQDEIKITTIKMTTFEMCRSITELVLPSEVESVGASAFKDCTGIMSINFSMCANLKTIMSLSFSGCTSLTEVFIPESVETFDYSIFQGCTNLERINVGRFNRHIGSYDGIVYSSDFGTVIACPQGKTKANLHSDSTRLGSNAFKECKKLTDVFILTSKIEVVGENSFFGCSELRQIALPASVKTIEANCFSGCSKLGSVSFGSGSTLEEIGKSVFTGCRLLSEVIFEGECALRRVGESAFDGCVSLEDISLPGSTSEIGPRAFANSGLGTVALGERVELIGASSFAGCIHLEGVFISNISSIEEIPESAFDGCTVLSIIQIPPSVERIGAHSFRGTGIRSLTLQPRVSQVGSGAFSGCASLEWVRYCGSAQLKGEGVFPAETVGYVTVSYPSDKLCNIKVRKSLTADCLPFPTETGCFTRPSAELSPRVIQSLVSATLVGEEEGGK